MTTGNIAQLPRPCPFCSQTSSAADVIVAMWAKEWDKLNTWLAEQHPELATDPARTPWGVLSYQIDRKTTSSN